mmetsp:Transcript_13086/g.31562  ORF Transcript_13086/g.31562 Transcript_13086/m.31562 type:complete len:124 (-) Transcript_13086:168-539(-)
MKSSSVASAAALVVLATAARRVDAGAALPFMGAAAADGATGTAAGAAGAAGTSQFGGGIMVAGMLLSPATIALIASVVVLTGIGGYYITRRVKASPEGEESVGLTGSRADAYGSLERARADAV